MEEDELVIGWESCLPINKNRLKVKCESKTIKALEKMDYHLLDWIKILHMAFKLFSQNQILGELPSLK